MATNDTVPVIDVSRLGDPALTIAIEDACREWGFFQLVHHGIEGAVIRALRREVSGFFALPLAVKRRFERSAANPWGFYDRELTKNTRDWKQIFDCGPPGDLDQPTPWPSSAPGLRPAALAYASACEKIAFRLLAAVSRSLGMPAEYLARGFRPVHTSFLRLNYYPVCPAPELPSDLCTPSRGYLGVNQHTDSGALTLLLQDEVAGLEVYRNGAWHGVEPVEGALVVNIGDIVQVWSNDRYRAALHRVRANADRARFSFPYFFSPSYETHYSPLPTTHGLGSPARYRPIRWGEFRALRAAGDYRDCGEEIQIDHYRIHSAAGDARVRTEEKSHGLH